MPTIRDPVTGRQVTAETDALCQQVLTIANANNLNNDTDWANFLNALSTLVALRAAVVALATAAVHIGP